MKYEEFQLLATQVQEVKSEGKKLIKFQIQVPKSPAGEVISAVPGEYDARSMRELLGDWETQELSWPDVIKVGSGLADVLFPQQVRDLLIRSIDIVKAQGKGLRLRLMVEGILHNIPWEYMLLNQGGGEATITDFLALSPDVSVVRHQATTMPVWSVEATLPAQMLIALASPSGWTPLALDRERRVITAAVKDQPHLEVRWKENPTPTTLLSEVGQVHLFHFAGHGDFKANMGTRPGTVEGEGLIVLDDGYGDPEELSASQLALQLRQIGTRVAMLGACRSGRRDDVNMWSSVAAALLKGELGAVVGMQYKVRDDSAVAFAGEFYTRLVAGLTIDEAVASGRIKMAQNDMRGWGAPVLYLRAEDGIIFPEYTANPVLERMRQDLHIEVEQYIRILRGKATAIEVEEWSEGSAKAKQEFDTIEESAEATAFKAKRVGQGLIETHQKADKVDGDITGVSIGNLG